MKIVIFVSGTVESSLSARAMNMGRELVKRGHEVSIVAPSSDKYNNFKRDKIKRIEGIRIIHPWQFSSHSEILNILTYIPCALLFTLFLRAEVVQIYKPTPLTIMGLVANWRRKTCLITDMDDLGYSVMERLGKPNWMVVMVRWCETRAVSAADGLIVASSMLRDRYRIMFPGRPVTWIPNGVSTLPLVNLVGKKPRIIFIGTLEDPFVIEPLLRALPEIRVEFPQSNKLLRIIGDGASREYLENLTRELKISHSVEFLGTIKHKNLKKFVHVGDLGYYCVPVEDTYRAASSQKIFDYMALGAVPIVNKVGDLPYYINYSKAGYYASNNLAKSCVTALQDYDGRRIRSNLARQRAERLFNWSKLVGKVDHFYQDIISQKFSYE